MQKQLKAIVSPFRGLRIEEFMKIHGSMPDQVQIKSFMTVGGPLVDHQINGNGATNNGQTARMKQPNGLNNDTVTTNAAASPHVQNRYASVKQQANGTTNGFESKLEERKGSSPNVTPGGVSSELKDILDDLQNN